MVEDKMSHLGSKFGSELDDQDGPPLDLPESQDDDAELYSWKNGISKNELFER